MPSENEKSLTFGPYLDKRETLLSERRKRARLYDQTSVRPLLVEEMKAEGWAFDKELKHTVRLKRPKAEAEVLENQFWVLMHKMGFPVLNEGRHFQIEFKRQGGGYDKKQIDVFAKDDESIVIAECKTQKKLNKKSMQAEIEGFSNLKKPLADAIRNHFGPNFNPKILWTFVTKNIIWSKPDRQRAADERISIFTAEKEIRYYAQLADHLGSAAKYQLLAEFFGGQKIPALSGKTVPAVRGRIGGKPFYSFVTTPRDLLKIAFVNHRTLDDPDGLPAYQRLIKKSRLQKIGQFIEKDGFFPNNIIVNFVETPTFEPVQKDARTGVHFGNLYLPNKYKSTWIIDGQHRLYGYAHLDEEKQSQNIFVLAFDQMPRTEEANLFVTINHEQQSVPAGLLEELAGDLKWDSEKPTEIISSVSARLIRYLDADLGGALYNRVVKQGLKETELTCLTVPGVKIGIRQSGLIGTPIQKKTMLLPGPLSASSNSTTLRRATDFLSLYLSEIRNANVWRWDRGRSGQLCTNVGVSGFIMLAGAIIEYAERKEKFSAHDLEIEDLMVHIREYLEPVLTYLDQTDDQILDQQLKVPFGSAGPKQYFFNMAKQIRAKYADFAPDGFDEWLAAQSREKSEVTDDRVKNIRAIIVAYLFDKMQALHGDNYFEKSVTDKKLQTKAYERSLDIPVEDRLSLEHYLDILEYKSIISSKQNWPIVKDVFNIPLKGSKGTANNTSWIAIYNDARKAGEHSTLLRTYTSKDIAFLEWLERELYERLVAAAAKGDAIAKKYSENGELFNIGR